MGFEKFEDIIAWQKSRELALCIYKLFEDCKDFGFKDQIQRASISVMNNIAEGYERNTNKEFARFLFIARGSCGEVRSMLIIAKDLKKINNDEFEKFHALSIEVSKTIYGLIKKLNMDY